MTAPGAGSIATDLVEYLVVALPSADAVATVAPELRRSVARESIRILDIVVVTVGVDGAVDFAEGDSFAALGDLRDDTLAVGALLSRHDIELVALALPPGSAAIIVVAEDRWAATLSIAASSAGGGVRAGERIDRRRVEAALARAQPGVEQP